MTAGGGPYTVHVDAERRTIVITGRGPATTDETIALIERTQPTFREHPGFNVIYDSSAMEIDSTAADMVRVATALFEGVGMNVGRFAVVVPGKREGLAMMFTALAQTHGINACVFGDVADARRWVARVRGEG